MNKDQSKDASLQYLLDAHQEAGAAIHRLVGMDEGNMFPSNSRFHEIPIRFKNQFIRIGFDKDTREVYFSGCDSDNNPWRVTP